MKQKKEQGWRSSKKRGKLKLPCNKKGIKRDLKYIYKELSMNLQLRSDNEAVTKRKNKKNSVKYEYQIRDYMCNFKWLLHKSCFFGFTVGNNEVAAQILLHILL